MKHDDIRCGDLYLLATIGNTDVLALVLPMKSESAGYLVPILLSCDVEIAKCLGFDGQLGYAWTTELTNVVAKRSRL